jgi:hypothetical protein
MLPYVNAALFALQLFANANQNAFSPKDAPTPFANDTPVRPAGYAFLIWLVIYVFTTLLVVTDAFFPRHAFYSTARDPTFLRACFTASCVVNMLWIVLFNWLRWVHVAAVDLVLMWLSLLPLYLFLTKAALVGSHVPWTQYVCSKLAIRLYFSWVSAAVMLNIAIAAQTSHGGYLSLRAYVAMLAVLSTVVLVGVVYGRDPVIGVVGLWALVALAKRSDGPFTGAVHDDFLKVQACATLAASLVGAFLVITTVRRIVQRHTGYVWSNHTGMSETVFS